MPFNLQSSRINLGQRSSCIKSVGPELRNAGRRRSECITISKLGQGGREWRLMVIQARSLDFSVEFPALLSALLRSFFWTSLLLARACLSNPVSISSRFFVFMLSSFSSSVCFSSSLPRSPVFIQATFHTRQFFIPRHLLFLSSSPFLFVQFRYSSPCYFCCPAFLPPMFSLSCSPLCIPSVFTNVLLLPFSNSCFVHCSVIFYRSGKSTKLLIYRNHSAGTICWLRFAWFDFQAKCSSSCKIYVENCVCENISFCFSIYENGQCGFRTAQLAAICTMKLFN